MVRHIVMWKLKEENRTQNAALIKEKLSGLFGVIPEILSCEVGVGAEGDASAFDAVLVADFADFEALARYQKDPRHVAVSEFVKSVRTDRKTVDFVR